MVLTVDGVDGTISYIHNLCDLVLMTSPSDNRYSYIRVGLRCREATVMLFSSTHSSQTASESSLPLKTGHVSSYLHVNFQLSRFYFDFQDLKKITSDIQCSQFAVREAFDLLECFTVQFGSSLATFRDNHRLHLKGSSSQVLLGLTYAT